MPGSKVTEEFIKYQLQFTCISGSIPFPKMAAIMEIEVNALKTLADPDDSKEQSLEGAFFDRPA